MPALSPKIPRSLGLLLLASSLLRAEGPVAGGSVSTSLNWSSSATPGWSPSSQASFWLEDVHGPLENLRASLLLLGRDLPPDSVWSIEPGIGITLGHDDMSLDLDAWGWYPSADTMADAGAEITLEYDPDPDQLLSPSSVGLFGSTSLESGSELGVFGNWLLSGPMLRWDGSLQASRRFDVDLVPVADQLPKKLTSSSSTGDAWTLKSSAKAYIASQPLKLGCGVDLAFHVVEWSGTTKSSLKKEGRPIETSLSIAELNPSLSAGWYGRRFRTTVLLGQLMSKTFGTSSSIEDGSFWSRIGISYGF
ncbi:MAG: hypothetical protein H6686_07585 [Fibrobacteria bacterium]|nr:hypothetical protein [Fibrobacteria bacterium]